ncbi:MAG: FAD-dependent oxidoreductase [Comamonadaceae bacterium]|nr:FAD-dependent oxidoreductase [Comamonadaceae bacterium]
MTSTPGLKNLVLLGLGHAHVQVLRGLAHSRPADLNLTVIAPRPLAVYSGMVPGFVAGHYTAEQCRIPLDALLARSGARTITGSAIGIDAETRTVSLASGEAVPWDWLSVNTGPIMDRDLLEVRMPGARRHALFVRPIDAFVQLWPQVAEMAASRPIHLAVVGAGAAGVELAMAASHALQGSGMPQGSHVSLVTGGEPPAGIYPKAVQARVQRALRRLNVTLIPETCVGVEVGALLLANGAAWSATRRCSRWARRRPPGSPTAAWRWTRPATSPSTPSSKAPATPACLPPATWPAGWMRPIPATACTRCAPVSRCWPTCAPRCRRFL